MSDVFTIENEGLFGTEYKPFVDTAEPIIQQQVESTALATQGYDTRQIDAFRQGVSIRTPRHQFSGMTPKLWSGNLNHWGRFITLGQFRNFTEFTDRKDFDDLQIKFDPALYVKTYLSQSNTDSKSFIEKSILATDTFPPHPLPIIFNDGPQQKEEAAIEPFTIPFRQTYNYSTYEIKAPHASLEDGNPQDINGAVNRIEQKITFKTFIEPLFFLDEGQNYIGTNSPDDSIIVEGYVALNNREIVPFDDTSPGNIVDEINTNDVEMIEALHALKINLENDIREECVCKSAPAGGTVYGPTAAKYGTDSIAFINTFRGA